MCVLERQLTTEHHKPFPDDPTLMFRDGNTMTGPNTTEIESSAAEFSIRNNQDVMALLAELLSNQYAFFAGVSREWRNAWSDLPKFTQAITPDTSISQLQWLSLIHI